MRLSISDDSAQLVTENYEFYYGWDYYIEINGSEAFNDLCDGDSDESSYGFYVRHNETKEIVFTVSEAELNEQGEDCLDTPESLLTGIGMWMEKEDV